MRKDGALTMPRAADSRRLSAAQGAPNTTLPMTSAPYAQELRELRSAVEAAWNRFNDCDQAFVEPAIYALLEADSRLQVVVAIAQRETEIRATEARISELSMRLAATQERRGRAALQDELLAAETYLHDLETRQIAPTDGHAETRRELLQRIGYLPQGVSA